MSLNFRVRVYDAEDRFIRFSKDPKKSSGMLRRLVAALYQNPQQNIAAIVVSNVNDNDNDNDNDNSNEL